jgi:ribosomal protein S7
MFIKSRNKYILGLNDYEFEFFLSKFYGTLISKGKKGHAIKLFNTILINFKNKFKKDPFIELRKAIDNLIPILMSTQKRIGKVYQAVPKLAIGNKRFVIMLS